VILIAAFAVSCRTAAPLAPSDSPETTLSATPESTTAAGLVPISTGTVPPPNSCISASGLPDRGCTPGATNPNVTQATISITICVPGYTAQVRPAATYTNSLKVDHMRAYGFADQAPGDFEEDHLIALELGGHPRDPKNLWPQRLAGASGALQKDRLENWAHDEVCAGRLQLADVQQRMAENWIELYDAMLAAAGTPQPTSAPTFAPDLPVLISASRHGLVSATTLAGAWCAAQARMPSGTISSAQGLAVTKIAVASGAVSWSYNTSTQTTPGTGTHTVTCTLDGVTRNASAPFSVP
jgi:hypothetical protein